MCNLSQLVVAAAIVAVAMFIGVVVVIIVRVLGLVLVLVLCVSSLSLFFLRFQHSLKPIFANTFRLHFRNKLNIANGVIEHHVAIQQQ